MNDSNCNQGRMGAESFLRMSVIGIMLISLVMPPTIALLMDILYLIAVTLLYPEAWDRVKMMGSIQLRPASKWMFPGILVGINLFIFFHPLVKIALMAVIIQYILVLDIISARAVTTEGKGDIYEQ